MHARKLRELDSNSSGVTIPKDILLQAGFVKPGDPEADLVEKPQLFIRYDPETREVSFKLPETEVATEYTYRTVEECGSEGGEGSETVGLTQEDMERLGAEVGD